MYIQTFVWILLAASSTVLVTAPVDGETYAADWLDLKALVTNENYPPDSVTFILNGAAPEAVPRLSTDWHTYMGNDLHTGFSLSPAPMEPTLLWAADSITGNTHEFCSPVVVNGVVYHVSDLQSTVFALDAVTGELIWSYYVNDHVDDAVTWYDGMIFVAADSAFCLDALTGERIWAYKPSTSSFKMNGTPAVGEGVAYFSYAPDWSSMDIYALDAFSGEEIWCSQLPSYSTGCVTLHGNRLYVPTYNGDLYALDTADGSILWSNGESVSGYWDSSPVVVDDVIYICGFDGIARGINCNTGTTIWSTPVSSWYIAATPAFANGRLFFADQVDSFHCLESDYGSQVWSVPGVQHGSPGIADGVVFFGEGADRQLGDIRALSADTGEEIWSYPTDGAEIYSSPAITDGIVYIAGMDWKLYAIGEELRFSYAGSINADAGENQLILTSWNSGSPSASDTVSFTVTGTGLNFNPTTVHGLAVSPNPCGGSTVISFDLPEEMFTTVAIFDLSGRQVDILENRRMSAGSHSVCWAGNGFPPGLYLCRLSGETISETVGICLIGN